MDAGQNRGWGLPDTVIAVGVVAGLIFVLIELTGQDINGQASQTISTALVMVLFAIFGSVGVALAHWQPRFALFGIATATLSLLAFGATVVSIWSGSPFLFGFLGPSDTSGTVGGITDLLAVTASATCVLLATFRPGEDGHTRLVRAIAIGALALFNTLAILAIVDQNVDIGARVYAIVATVYVVATAVLLILRLLPTGEEAPAPS
jgi:hypothetical protein